jgi:hypothetical protein
MNNAIMGLNFFEVINAFEKQPKDDDKAGDVSDGENGIHFIYF